ncbi:MAG TPA: outer membrane beta-barrel protein [Vicinamibacterales bacterium]|nr:outer membrane beta-barrel protein [Vicinamibacterales bacterium]
MTQVLTRRSVTIAIFVCATTLAAASDARAQGYISPFVGFDFGGDSGCPEITGCEDKKLNYGIAFGALNNVGGFEQEIAYANHFFGETEGLESSVLTVMSNFMLAPNLQVTRPYFLVGLGLIKTNVELTPTSLLENSNNHFGWDIGGGLMIFFGRHVAIRGDIRYFHSFQDLELGGITVLDGTKLDFGRAAAGMVFKF